jgi:hypothetical protein
VYEKWNKFEMFFTAFDDIDNMVIIINNLAAMVDQALEDLLA